MSFVDHYFPSRFRRIARFLTFILLLPALLGCGAVNVINPLNPPSATPTSSITPTATSTQTPTPSLTPTPTERPALCGGPRVMFILLIGSDARRDSYAIGLADSIRLVRVDFVEPGIQLLPFQRDLYVEIPGIESHGGITHGKLNQAFLYGNPGYGYYDDPTLGPGLLALTMEHNLGAQVDHYAAVNLQAFVRIVDALEGIDITLPNTVDGRVKGSKDPSLYFEAGDLHLNGYRTMLLARMRPSGDFSRSEVQNLILKALAEEVLSPTVLRKLPELVQSLYGSAQTDIGTTEARQLLCLAAMLEPENIEFVSFPESLFKLDRVQDPVLGNTSILAADFEVLKTYVQKFNDGLWFEPEGPVPGPIIP
jgi:polyisoprenyl-teichoic acid--peptidoglycan teichoic acid transferase